MIRRARLDELAAIGDLAVRSKGHWGYDAAFLEGCPVRAVIGAVDRATRG